MTVSTTASSDTEYAVRLYEPGDFDDICSLYEIIFGKTRSREWFEWRYDTPILDGPQVIVADRGGTVVGAEPFITFRIETGEGIEIAVQPADAMVHPDHRRQGLLTRMTEFALDYYAMREPAFVFNFPNRQAVDAYRKLGWREVPAVTTDFRVQNPGRFLPIENPRLGRMIETSGRRISAALYASVESNSGDRDLTVERQLDIPATTLAMLYERDVPDALHAKRDAEFFKWRLGNPDWSTRTYIARRGGEPVAAMVSVTEETNGSRFTKVLEALPMGGKGVEDAMRRLMATVCHDHPESDVIKMAHPTVPRWISRQFCFFRGDFPPLSWATNESTMVVRPLDPDGEDWTIGGRTLTEWDHWEITFSEQDTSY
jgi:GNAT superfamily N-acetyltransferase